MQCEIARKFFEMMTAIISEQKMPREYPGGQILYHAEIDLLEKINESPDSNVSMLSEKSHVTKSAITQISGKLLDKGLIEKYQDPKNKKEKYYRLTEAGQKVRKTHAEFHKAASDNIRNYLCSLEPHEKRTILNFMEVMKQYMPVCAFPCQYGGREKACVLVQEKEGMNEKC